MPILPYTCITGRSQRSTRLGLLMALHPSPQQPSPTGMNDRALPSSFSRITAVISPGRCSPVHPGRRTPCQRESTGFLRRTCCMPDKEPGWLLGAGWVEASGRKPNHDESGGLVASAAGDYKPSERDRRGNEKKNPLSGGYRNIHLLD